jgi:serine/threonine-protein kinase
VEAGKSQAQRLAQALVEEFVDEHEDAFVSAKGVWPSDAREDLADLRETYAKRIPEEVRSDTRFLELALIKALDKFGLQPPDAPPPEMPQLPEGPYEILEEVGKGASGTTYMGRHVHLQRKVAIKFLDNTNPARRERFLREGRALAALDHPNIVKVHDRGTLDDRPYLVLEFVGGGPLTPDHGGGRPTPLEEALKVAHDVLSGLGAAHARGILHRDIKPANLLRADDGRIKIADFGVAKIADMGTMTQLGASVGTPFYMAPEQFAIPGMQEQASVDARSDLYAVGIVLLELLTGQPPFSWVTNLPELVILKLSGVPEIPKAVPPWLKPWVERILAVEPAQRFQTAEEALEGLAAAEEASKAPAPAPSPGKGKRPDSGRRGAESRKGPPADPDRPKPKRPPSGRADAPTSESGRRRPPRKDSGRAKPPADGRKQRPPSERRPAAKRPPSERRPAGRGKEPKRKVPAGAVGLTLKSDQQTFDVLLEPGVAQSLGRSSKRSQIVVKDQRISREHCRLFLRNGEIYLQDLGSSNGTYVNRRRVKSEVRLTHGDRLVVGDTTLKVNCPDMAGTRADETLSCSRCSSTIEPDSLLTGKALVVRGALVCQKCNRGAPLEECLSDEGYVIEERLDDSGLTNVYRALRPSVGEVVAIRVLDREQTRSQQLQERFLADARSLARLRHPNTAWVHDVSQTPRMTYVVMDYVVGELLDERVSRRGQLALAEALQIIHGVTSACELSEGLGLFHRNLSPRSIMINSEGDAKLIGFRLGGDAGRSEPSPAQLRYLAPERLRDGAKVDPGRADLYALGANLLLALTGKGPHQDLPDDELRRQAAADKLPAPTIDLSGIEATEDLSPLASFLEQTLQPDPEKRQESLRQAFVELGAVVRAVLFPDFSGPIEALFSLVQSASATDSYSTAVLTRGRKKKGALLAGSFSGDELVELLQMLGLNQRSGTLTITTPTLEGRFALRSGAIAGAVCGDQRGREAARILGKIREGEFSFEAELAAQDLEGEPIPIPGFLLDLLRDNWHQGLHPFPPAAIP